MWQAVDFGVHGGGHDAFPGDICQTVAILLAPSLYSPASGTGWVLEIVTGQISQAQGSLRRTGER